ncbi:hypothetical protein F5Y19DRAFT_103449 [Xylariaceae sp. FL1651]|nr:hypothetical protein F5Y19DRAFT_103449 [Xylariaceae sp. FL1651]
MYQRRLCKFWGCLTPMKFRRRLSTGWQRQMRQIRICELWGSSCPPRRTFLDLPANIRQRIYEEAGLTTHCNILLGRFYGFGVGDCKAMDTDVPVSDERVQITTNLLITCKVVHDEVSTLILSHNKIIVGWPRMREGLDLLQRLPPGLCAKLRDLSVLFLTNYNIHFPPHVPDHVVWNHAVLMWQSAASRLLSYSQHRTLTLNLICDTGDSKSTSDVLQPLLDHPGVLKDLKLRLYPERQSNLTKLALEVATTILAKRSEIITNAFPFSHLPVEIRWKILEYTDLVTPLKEIYWNTELRFHTHYRDVCGGDSCDKDVHHGCQFRYCDPSDYFTTGKFCCIRYSAYSSRCRCWAPPRALLLVDWATYYDAIRTLCKNNRIIVAQRVSPWYHRTDEVRICPWINWTDDNRLDASVFLLSVASPYLLTCLTTLELSFGNLQTEEHISPSAFKLADWCAAVERLRSHANLRALKIIVQMESSNYDYLLQHTLLRDSRLTRMSDDLPGRYALHSLLLSPLRSLSNMKAFFVYLEGRARRHLDNYGLQQVIAGEAWLEKSVMGEAYDSYSQGKDEHQTCQKFK